MQFNSQSNPSDSKLTSSTSPSFIAVDINVSSDGVRRSPRIRKPVQRLESSTEHK
jgi:hypothetical protein